MAAPAAMDGPVVLSYDGSAHAERAVRRAATLLRPKHAVVLPVTQQPFKDLAAESGHRVALDAGFAPVTVAETRHGRVATILLEEARRRCASVIVVESHGRSPAPSALLGSVAGALVDHSDIPVLVVPPELSPSSANEPVFACYDASRIARQALGTAADLLAGRAAIVATFIPAVDDVALLRSTLPWCAAGEIEERLARLDRQEAEAPVERAADGARAAAVAGFVPEPVAIGGMDASSEEEEQPWKRLLRAAECEHAACVVVGHRPSIKQPGSTVHGLVHHADRPVLVAPAAL